MIKVIVADDEERICQLINALVDWETLGMEVVGIAHNGLEAIEMTEKLCPDILVTDIRMPGCSGLELIERTKKRINDLEIVIISGYAHFEYAQQAIKFGVGDYLLKPINKVELNATLNKLKERICHREETERDKRELLRKAEQDEQRLQKNLLEELVQKPDTVLSVRMLQDTFHLQVQPGVFQAFWLRMDCGTEEFSEASVGVLMEKAREVLERGLKEKCVELLLGIRELACIGIINYRDGHQEEIRRVLKSCLNQLELQKSLFRPVMFSMGAGTPYREAERLGESMKEASRLVEERLIRGTGRFYERLGQASALEQSNVLERYLREVVQAVDVQSCEKAEEAVNILIGEVSRTKDVRGCEILELVASAMEIFAAKIQMPERTEYLERFRRQCYRCSKAEEIFACLKEVQNGYISQMIEKKENDTVRPIRNAKQYIQAHYSEPITQEEVSSIVGLSPAYFSVLFKKTEGEGFAKYLINVRMEKAKILLRESNIPVAEICRKVGYNDLKHFTHTFEKATGVKPATYRKLYG